MNKGNMDRNEPKIPRTLHSSKGTNSVQGKKTISESLQSSKKRALKLLEIIDEKIIGGYGKFIPAAVFASSMAVVGALWKGQINSDKELMQVYQAQQTQKLKMDIERVITGYTQLLYNSRGYFLSKESVSQNDFNQFLNTINYKERFPSVQAFSYSKYVKGNPAGQESQFHDLTIPHSYEGEQEDSAPILITSDPKGVNSKIIGLDNFHERMRRESLENARDTDMPILTSITPLFQADESDINKKGYILFIPVYKSGKMESLNQRRANIRGWLSISFFADTLFQDVVTTSDISGKVSIFEENQSSNPVFTNLEKEVITEEKYFVQKIVSDAKLEIGGKVWKILQIDTKNFYDWYQDERTRLTLVHGTQSSLMFTFFSWLLVRNRSKIIRTLHEVSLASDELESAKRQYMTLFRESGVPMMLIDPVTGNIVDANNQACELYGFSSSTFMDYPVSHFAGDDESVVQSFRVAHVDGIGTHEFKHKMLDGTIRDVHLTTTFIEHNGEVHILAVIQDLTERNRAIEEKVYMLDHDVLTGLPNRRLLKDRLDMAVAGSKRNQMKVGVLFIDLDNFKNVNDSQGHAVGDILLKQAANRMKLVLRGCDTLARQGGDEFIVVLPNIHGDSDLASVAEKLIAEIEKVFKINSNELFVGASIGGSLYPDNTRDTEDLLQFADMAMYEAKTSGKSTFRYYKHEYGLNVREKLELVTELHYALLRKELEVHYQPIIDVKTGKVYELEALARWNSPRFGSVPPSKFIPLAEDSGLIVEIGEWIMDSACNQIKVLQEQGHKDIRCAVNLSARQFRSKQLINCIQKSLEKSGISPNLLTIELTETLLIKDVEEVVKLLKEIADMGISISIDDFGTGYSSLAYLRDFPINVLKIDKSFVSDIEKADNALNVIKAIASLAHGLGMKVVVEGIDNHNHKQLLIDAGCDYLQGYCFSVPVNPTDSSFDGMLQRKFF